jgi:hypothetical protein
MEETMLKVDPEVEAEASQAEVETSIISIWLVPTKSSDSSSAARILLPISLMTMTTFSEEVSDLWAWAILSKE